MIDEHTVTDLRLFIDNDADLDRQQATPIRKNLITKRARGEYKHDLAVKAFGYLVESGAKKYAQRMGGVWHHRFDVPTRRRVAEELTEFFEEEAKHGNYDYLLPKKYQKEKQEYLASKKAPTKYISAMPDLPKRPPGTALSERKGRHHSGVKSTPPAQLQREIDTFLGKSKGSNKAIDTVHTLKMKDGRVITTTWHDTRAQANARVKGTRGRDPSKDRVLPGGVLGNFRAITWSY